MVIALPFGATAAHAGVRDVASHVADQWRGAGASVTLAPSRFLHEDETINIAFSQGPVGGCTTVALVGARGLSFHARGLGNADAAARDEARVRASSVAGVLALALCGDAPLQRIVVTSDAGRGAIETVVARSERPLPSLASILPERTGGVLPPAPDVGESPALPPASRRAEAAEARARRDGARVDERRAWEVGADGTGFGEFGLAAGCHRINLFGSEGRNAERRGRLDIDAELRDKDDVLLARDRSEAPDAQLDTCVGEPTIAVVLFVGASPSSAVLSAHASWPIPERLPSLWGPEARAQMAGAMRVRRAKEPTSDPVFIAQGGAGSTRLPVAVQPGACYLAVGAITHGVARRLGMRALLGARVGADERGFNNEAWTVAFCTRDEHLASLEVDARGTALGWGLALFQVEAGLWGGP